MNNVIKKATNTFSKGLVMDFSPENTKNEVLTHALNATLLTFNGNEMSLQNDMGNARVETAYLPEGFMPVGTCEYGGIIYIVSYNPLEDKSQIGCFPSPERNISSDEIGIPKVHISKEDFQEISQDGRPTGVLKHNTQYVLLKNDNLNPGDKFLICSNREIYDENLENLLVKKDPKYNSDSEKDKDVYELKPHPILALNVVSLEESGKIVYLNSDIRRYDVDKYKYHILGTGGNVNGEFNQQDIDIDSYRNVLSSGYSVFKAKTSGKLAILAELIMIDSYSVTHSLKPSVDEQGKTIDGKFDIILHHEVEPTITNENYNIAPKLKYYYLQKSQGYIQYLDLDNFINTRTLFEEKDGSILQNINQAFLNTSLSSIYEEVESVNLDKPLQSECQFNFPYTDTYHGQMISYNGSINESVHTKLTEGKYHRLSHDQIKDNINYFSKNFKFYKYNDEGSGYEQVNKDHIISKDYTYYVKNTIYHYNDAQRLEEYKDENLYKLTTYAQVATETEIKNTEIEKFQYEEIHTYEPATREDINAGKELWYINNDPNNPNDLKFTSLTGTPQSGVQYYIRIVERNLVSIGFTINSDTIKGIIYYYPTIKNYEKASEEDISKYYNFDMYPREEKPPYGSPITLYYREPEDVYIPATQYQIENSISLGIILYYNSNYTLVSDIIKYGESNQLFIVASVDTYLTYDQFKPNTKDNYIYGYKETTKKFPKDDPLYLCTLSDFIPTDPKSNNYTPYPDLKLGTIQLPSIVYTHGADLPFKYDYTIVPCMTYGRLDHLAVSNTIDFSKLHAFNRSGFTTWKYRIDDGYLRLTVGAEIFDTYETYKVDGLIFEFYDHRGFAGSLEFVDKKSYNGIFTKVIPLNTLQSLSKKRILDGKQTTEYKHNINIIEGYIDHQGYTGNYYLNNKKVEYRNQEIGWQYSASKTEYKIEDFDNDCGTIYSNVIYGVKTYLRRTTDYGVEYIRKPDLFVYTLPIFNEYYYKIDNFMNISNPQLQFMLTYKLMDKSEKVPYSSRYITAGYNADDKKQVDAYINGIYDLSQSIALDLIKYYKYTGTTDLYLEVGLKQDYNDINLAYNPELNKYFNCKLQLISNDDENSTYNVVSESSELTDPKTILNYNKNDLPLDINKIGFESDYSSKLDIKGKSGNDGEGLFNSNFINHQGNNPIKIKYDFVVGYTINISNIRETHVPATTVCALFHKNDNGEYNYEDFGIYTQQEDGKTKYLSSKMMYNTGTTTTEIFGICRQIATTGENVTKQCQIQTSIETEVKKIKTPGKLNSGDPLKRTVSNLGKLTFCQPHAHGIYQGSGVNVGEKYGVFPNGGKWVIDSAGINTQDDTYGIRPEEYLFNKPRFNLSLNTKNSIQYYSEFLSTFDYTTVQDVYRGWDYDHDPDTVADNIKSDPMTMRVFTGFDGEQIATFNQKLIKTMQSVYAYNPDYDSLRINAGDVSLQKYSPKFISNIISRSAKFNFGDNTLNDYIYISNINLTKYLTDLNTFSSDNLGDSVKVKNNDKFISHLQFTPDYTYCGTDVAPYLINQLTYNTVVPAEIEEELTFNKSNLIIVKHHDNTKCFISGALNKRMLYGYNEDYNKLITLDVSNYKIASDGTLSLKNMEKETNYNVTHILNQYDLNNIIKSYGSDSSVQDLEPNWGDNETEPIKVRLSLDMFYSTFNIDCKKSDNKNGVYLQINYLPSNTSTQAYNFIITPKVQVDKGTKYNYKVSINSITLKVGGCDLSKNVLTFYNINLLECDEKTLNALIYSHTNDKLLFKTNENREIQVSSDEIRKNEGGYNKVYIGKRSNKPDLTEYNSTQSHSIPMTESGLFISLYDQISQSSDVGLFYLEIEKIEYTLIRVKSIYNEKSDIIIFPYTDKYSKISEEKYVVDSKYDSSRLRGTSITLNDLIYEPNISGHRLFMKNNLCEFSPAYRGRLFYRSMTKNKDGDQWHKKHQDQNTLYMMTGPCFTIDNLDDESKQWVETNS